MKTIRIYKHHVTFFASVLIVSDILTIQIVDLANADQGHRVRHSQWHHSMANINIHKRNIKHVVTELLRLNISYFFYRPAICYS